MCQTPDTALTALAYWIKYENVEQDAICAIYKRICADMDVQSAYYLVRIIQAISEPNCPIDIQPLIKMVSEFGGELNNSLSMLVNQEMLEQIRQESGVFS
ncbi:hypothetical protein [Moraxella lacunata]|uniref:hypothetical protein n=1 Tax=Moraxella lacunata TaxID=477 RepID=UPI003EDF0433